jgi:hypothetical protein
MSQKMAQVSRSRNQATARRDFAVLNDAPVPPVLKRAIKAANRRILAA